MRAVDGQRRPAERPVLVGGAGARLPVGVVVGLTHPAQLARRRWRVEVVVAIGLEQEVSVAGDDRQIEPLGGDPSELQPSAPASESRAARWSSRRFAGGRLERLVVGAGEGQRRPRSERLRPGDRRLGDGDVLVGGRGRVEDLAGRVAPSVRSCPSATRSDSVPASTSRSSGEATSGGLSPPATISVRWALVSYSSPTSARSV